LTYLESININIISKYERRKRAKMLITKIDANLFKEMILSSALTISNRKELLNELNVFPVPDGDTGKNLSSTFSVIGARLEGKNYRSIDELVGDLEESALMGATGNVGMLLTQFLGGFCSVIKGNGGITSELLAKGLKEGSMSAYQTFVDPKEGTALTVLREVALNALESLREEKDLVGMLKDAWLRGKQALWETRNLLPELKRAGVVDAGGLGILCMLEGWLRALGEQPNEGEFSHAKPLVEKSSINFRYCTECLIKSEVNKERIQEVLRNKGNCLLVASEKGLVKVHIHTNDPSQIIANCKQWGKLKKIKVDDMEKMHQRMLSKRRNKWSRSLLIVP
jgi:hypothetical protein